MRTRSFAIAPCFVFVIALSAGSACADPVVLTFEGVPDGSAVGHFYDQRFGVVFAPGVGAIVDSDAGGSGFIANEPSPNTVLYMGLKGTHGRTSADIVRGFGGQLKFWYTEPSDPDPAVVTSHFAIAVFSGLGGTGRRLGEWRLPQTDPNAAGDPTGGVFGDWRLFDGSFDGIARSITWTDRLNLTGAVFDNLEFTPATTGVTPEPSSVALAATAVIAAFFTRRRMCRGTPQ